LFSPYWVAFAPRSKIIYSIVLVFPEILGGWPNISVSPLKHIVDWQNPHGPVAHIISIQFPVYNVAVICPKHGARWLHQICAT
jgi:hypothetical protein